MYIHIHIHMHIHIYIYRCTRWPATRRRLSDIRRIQSKMVAIVMQIRMQPGELAIDFFRRRARLAANQCRLHGLWHLRYLSRVVSWYDHLSRPQNAASWPALLLHFRGRAWLVAQRLAAGSTSVFGGRTGTRATPGHV